MSARLQDLRRRVRVWTRDARYSRLVLGDRRVRAIRAELETVYRATNRFLRSLGVDYWLVYGTLLGYHREGRLLDGDRDVDFGAHEKEYPRIWQARRALPAGFRLYDTSHRHHGPKLYVAYQSWEADIYFYKDAGGRLQSWETSRNPGDTAPFPRELVYPLRPATFLGESTNVPHDAEAYLVHTYGYIGRDAVRDPTTGYWRPRVAPGGPGGDGASACGRE
jgi:hypothetical protein